MTERLSAREKFKAHKAERRELLLAERRRAEEASVARAALKWQMRRDARTAAAAAAEPAAIEGVEAEAPIPEREEPVAERERQPRRRYHEEASIRPKREPEVIKPSRKAQPEPEPLEVLELAPTRDVDRSKARLDAELLQRHEAKAARRREKRAEARERSRRTELEAIAFAEQTRSLERETPVPREPEPEPPKPPAKPEESVQRRSDRKVRKRDKVTVAQSQQREAELSREREAALRKAATQHARAERRNAAKAEAQRLREAVPEREAAPEPQPAPVAAEHVNEDAGLPSPGDEAPGKRVLRLRTAGGFIVDELGGSFHVRGVTILGLDALAPAGGQSLRDALSLDDTNLNALTNWSINVVRVPFSAATIMSGNGHLTAATILSGVDDLIAALVETKTYTLLSLQAPIAAGATGAPLPDQTTFDAWSLLATRYAGETGVLFEIFSSPLAISGDWLDAAQMLIGAIRSRHPSSLLFAGNGSGGSDVAWLPLRFSTGDPTPNVVSTIRVAAGTPFPADEYALAALADSFPVVATDWAAAEASSLDRAPELAANTFARLGIGWVAGNWNADPRLVASSQTHGMAATRWGNTVVRAMTLAQREPLERVLPDAT